MKKEKNKRKTGKQFQHLQIQIPCWLIADHRLVHLCVESQVPLRGSYLSLVTRFESICMMRTQAGFFFFFHMAFPNFREYITSKLVCIKHNSLTDLCFPLFIRYCSPCADEASELVSKRMNRKVCYAFRYTMPWSIHMHTIKKNMNHSHQ